MGQILIELEGVIAEMKK